jgi:uncharacterized membrane protein
MMKQMRSNIRHRLVSGILILVPFGVTLLVMGWLFSLLRRLLRPAVWALVAWLSEVPFAEDLPPAHFRVLVPALAVFILLLLLYLIGAMGTRLVGRRLLARIEELFEPIPLVGALYSASRQVLETVSLGSRPGYKSVVFTEFPRAECWVIGFLTGHLEGTGGRRFCKVFVPTAPNPMTGFLEIVPERQVVEANLSVEEAFKMIISGGLVSPDGLSLNHKTLSGEDSPRTGS